jgi:hypothetical protein
VEQVQLGQEMLPCLIADFLIKYLGLPLSVGKVSKAVLHEMID